MIRNDNQTPMESRKTVELYNNYTKPKNNNKYLWVFDLKQAKKRGKQIKQNLFGFLNTKPKLKDKANQY